MVDGVSGVDFLTAILSPSPDPSFEPGPPWTPRSAPSGAELVASEAWRRTKRSIDLARSAAGAIATPVRAATAALDRAAGLAETFWGAMTPASETPLNPPAIGPHRRFDWTRTDLVEAKAVRAALGGTLNDVVLATVVGALRTFLQRRGVETSGLDFRALIPVSVRAQSERAALGNKVAQMLAALPIDEADPRRRIARVAETTMKLKQSHQVDATELLEEIGDWTATAVMTSTMRLAANRRTYNLIVTNVPGPQVPLYMIGAPLLETYPMVPLFSNQALGIALLSYDGSLYWGLNADWDAVPDLHDLVGDLRASFAELRDAAHREARAQPRGRAARA
jgi:WS/DGAT/MGAT family acyltransferase